MIESQGLFRRLRILTVRHRFQPSYRFLSASIEIKSTDFSVDAVIDRLLGESPRTQAYKHKRTLYLKKENLYKYLQNYFYEDQEYRDEFLLKGFTHIFSKETKFKRQSTDLVTFIHKTLFDKHFALKRKETNLMPNFHQFLFKTQQNEEDKVEFTFLSKLFHSNQDNLFMFLNTFIPHIPQQNTFSDSDTTSTSTETEIQVFDLFLKSLEYPECRLNLVQSQTRLDFLFHFLESNENQPDLSKERVLKIFNHISKHQNFYINMPPVDTKHFLNKLVFKFYDYSIENDDDEVSKSESEGVIERRKVDEMHENFLKDKIYYENDIKLKYNLKDILLLENKEDYLINPRFKLYIKNLIINENDKNILFEMLNIIKKNIRKREKYSKIYYEYLFILLSKENNNIFENIPHIQHIPDLLNTQKYENKQQILMTQRQKEFQAKINATQEIEENESDKESENEGESESDRDKFEKELYTLSKLLEYQVERLYILDLVSQRQFINDIPDENIQNFIRYSLFKGTLHHLERSWSYLQRNFLFLQEIVAVQVDNKVIDNDMIQRYLMNYDLIQFKSDKEVDLRFIFGGECYKYVTKKYELLEWFYDNKKYFKIVKYSQGIEGKQFLINLYLQTEQEMQESELDEVDREAKLKKMRIMKRTFVPEIPIRKEYQETKIYIRERVH